MFKAWIRVLWVKFYNSTSGQYLNIGKTIDDKEKPRITISGAKYLSAIKDNFTIKIYNLSYKEIIQIMNNELYGVQIYAGYLNDGKGLSNEGKKIFDGGIINIVNSKRDYKDNVCTFVCASKLMANANKYRLNFTLQSSINMYAAINWVCKKSKISNTNISKEFKYKFFKNVSDASSSSGNYLDLLSSGNSSYFINTDSSEGDSVSIFDISRGDRRKYTIDIKKGMIIGDAPEVTSNGVIWSSLPIINYMCGDTCVLDNSIIDVSSGQDSYSGSISNSPNALYLDTQGLYNIFTLQYTLDNYAIGNFEIKITAKAKSLFTNLTNSGSVTNG